MSHTTHTPDPIPDNGNLGFYYKAIAVACLVVVIAEVIGWQKGDAVKIAVLFGTAILALLAPNLESLTLGKDGLAAKLRKQIERTETKVDDTKKAARETDQQLNQKLAQLFEELKELRKHRGADARSFAPTDDNDFLPPITSDDDPQKGRFGGNEKANNRRIVAEIERSLVENNWCTVTLKVRGAGMADLSGEVVFYLHHTFVPDRYIVPVIGGEATLVIRAWGAFTVGAIADGGKTLLELDLATSPNVSAPTAWRER